MNSRLMAPESETAVLGAVVADPTVLGWLDLSDDHFAGVIHRHVFRAMRKLYDSDKPLDDVTILDACLAENPTLSSSDVSNLVIASPTADNAEYWVDILEEHRRRRVISKIIERATEFLGGSRAGDSGEIHDGILSGLEGLSASGGSSAITLDDSCRDVMQKMELQWAGGMSTRMETGIHAVDVATGGMPIGVLSALGARPGVGKSTALWNICNHSARNGDHVLVMTNEDRPDVASRLSIANRSGIERRRLVSGILTEEEKNSIRSAVGELEETNRCYHVLRVHGKKMTDICREATGLIRRYKIRLIALDYIQNVPNPPMVMNRNYGIEENLTTLEAMVAKEDIVCIMVGQIKRIEDGRRPTMQDFKDSGSIEQKCKMMMVLTDGDVEGTMEVDVVKNSEGYVGKTITLDVDKGTGRIS